VVASIQPERIFYVLAFYD